MIKKKLFIFLARFMTIYIYIYIYLPHQNKYMFDFNVDSKKISLQNFVNTSDIQRYLVVKKKKKKKP